MDIKISHLSYEVQGIDKEPTVTLGRAAMALEREGIRTVNGDKNREIKARNDERNRLRQQKYERSLSRDRSRDRSR